MRLKILFKKAILRIEYWLPILLLILINTHYFFLNDILSNVVLAIIFISITQCFRRFKLGYLSVDLVFGILFNIMLGIQLGHFYLFGGNLNASTFFIVFNSNNSEVSDFLAMYFNLKLSLIFFSLIIGIIIGLIMKIKSGFYQKKQGFSKRTWIILGLIVIALFSTKYIRRKIFPYAAYTSFISYKEEKLKFDAVTQDRMGGDFTDVNHVSKENDEVYVLIIGESTTRRHMQLYDYKRPTNPKLTSIKDDLLVYKDVISPHTRTLQSLGKVLTLASFDAPKRKFDGTIIQLFNKAGFNTYWISNQSPVGIYDTETTIIAKNCNESIFVGTQGTTEVGFDERILPPMEEILNTKKGKKLIVLHLMGSHVHYRKRYPKSFEVFKDEPNIRFKSKKAFKITNKYDNTVLYNDYVVSEVIKKVKSHTKNKNAFVMYFSDHGEELYEDIDMAGHDDINCTQSMYDIPFILWQSQKFKTSNTNFVFDINRPYSTEDLLYTLSDLSGIHFKEFDPTKSIVNKKFISKKRLILNNVDYNAHFKIKK